MLLLLSLATLATTKKIRSSSTSLLSIEEYSEVPSSEPTVMPKRKMTSLRFLISESVLEGDMAPMTS